MGLVAAEAGAIVGAVVLFGAFGLGLREETGFVPDGREAEDLADAALDLGGALGLAEALAGEDDGADDFLAVDLAAADEEAGADFWGGDFLAAIGMDLGD